MQSPTLSNSCKCLSVLKPEQQSSMEAIYDMHDVFMWLPMSLLVHLVLLSSPLTLSKADLEQLASCLNSLKFAAAFSSVTVRALHLMHSLGDHHRYVLQC